MSSPNLNFAHSKTKLRRIAKVQFSVFDPELVRKGSVTQKCTINNEEVRAGVFKFERDALGRPSYGGVNDPRMGTSDRAGKCRTCNCSYTGSSKMSDCPGHFGHIELYHPVYHIGFLDEVLKILRCVCYHCSKLLINPADAKVQRAMASRAQVRLHKLEDTCRGRRKCGDASVGDLNKNMAEFDTLAKKLNGDHLPAAALTGCGGYLPTYNRSGTKIVITFPDEMEDIPGGNKKQGLSAKKAFEILKSISDADAEILGLDPKWARPEWLLVSVLPVPPPQVRPQVESNGVAALDDLTFQLVNVVKSNLRLQDCVDKGEPAHIILAVEDLLQVRVTTFFDNERADVAIETHRNGRPLKTLRQRLKGKEGRIRGNLMGKRVDFTARTVITADPNLSIDQVGVPRSVALELTVPVIATPFNIEELRKLVDNGPDVWPGARFIINSDFTRFDLRYTRNVLLEPGWTVERHLRDDDVVLFNRQPSLHKMSIMGHKAKILDWSTFRLNLSCTTPYNADFDGDEMNLHVPQSITARADADQLMMTPRNIITPQNNRNVMGIVQDALLGVTRMTKRDVFIEKDVFMNTMMWIPSWDGVLPTPAIIKPRCLWTGKQLFSMICPKINYSGKSKNHASPNNFNVLDSEVLIYGGILLQGIVDKNIVGTSGGSIVHVTWLEKGWMETRDFMNQTQAVVNYWLANTSFSVGISDTVADSITMLAIQSTLDDAKQKVRDIMLRAQEGKLAMQPGKPLMESFEMNVNEVLNAARATVGKSAQNSLKERNAIKGTVMAGSKGSFLNISQIIACVGQQNVQGARIKYGFQQRTLPHYSKDDLGMESKGFVENSYLRGLTPQEFFFHAMGGREGIIDTAVKTSDVGYIQRRLVKAMESVMARYDSTLRNSRGCVMQFLYGEDGMDAQRIEFQRFDSYTLSDDAFRSKYLFDLKAPRLGEVPFLNVNNETMYSMTRDLIDSCRKDLSLAVLLDEEFRILLLDRVRLREILACRGPGSETDADIYLPVNLDRLIWNVQRQFCISLDEPTSLHPRKILEVVNSLCKMELIVVRGDDPISKEAQNNSTLLFQIHLRSKLSCKRVIEEYRLNEAAIMALKGYIVNEFNAAIVNPGEMCGVLAAQSLGEPATQMTLNTFHNTGISAKNVTLGVPRLNEILNVSKQVRTPSVTIYLKEEHCHDEQEANDLQVKLEYTTLGDVTLKTEIHYDPDPKSTVIDEDMEFLNEYFQMPDEDVDHDNMSPWVLRIILNGEVFHNKKLSMDEISTKITDFFDKGVHVICSDDNATPLVLRVRITIRAEDRAGETEDVTLGTEDDELLRKMQKTMLENLHLRGIAGIKKVYLSQKKKPRWTSNRGFEDEPKEWMMETDGSNLKEVMISHTVDPARITSNDVNEMYDVLGIEGVRSSLFFELRAVLSFDGSYVNYRHIACLADCMTFSGTIMAVSRHGINKGESGPLLRASFEETVEVFMNAAAFSQYDILDGVSENVLLGQLARVGTGVVDLLVDYEKLKNAVEYGEGIYGAKHQFSQWQATPYGTPGITTPKGDIFGSTPAMGAFTPAFNTPSYMTPFADGTTPSRSPGYSMSSPFTGANSPHYTPSSSNAYSSSSPSYAPSPKYSSSSPGYSPTSPAYSPTSPAYSPTSPAYSPTSPAYSPTSPAYSPTSPAYSPTSPAYSPTSPAYSPTSPAYSPTSPAYSPTSPAVASRNDDEDDEDNMEVTKSM